MKTQIQQPTNLRELLMVCSTLSGVSENSKAALDAAVESILSNPLCTLPPMPKTLLDDIWQGLKADVTAGKRDVARMVLSTFAERLKITITRGFW
jgi:hypothetical protein